MNIDIPQERRPHMFTEPYTEEDLDKIECTFLGSELYGRCAASEFHRWRDVTILRTACLLGLRPGEVLNLRWSMINWKSNEIYINPYTNKQRDPESAYLNKAARKLLTTWRLIFNKFIPACDYLFPSLATFEPLCVSAYNKRLLQISKEAGIYKVLYHTHAGQPIGNKRFYSARKYYGTKIYLKEKDPMLVMRGLRQKKLSSTQPYIYTARADMDERLDSVFS